MQEFSVAFGRVSRATFSANSELKNHVAELIGRAYFNLHGVPIAAADPSWTSAVTATALQLCLDERVGEPSTRDLIQLFETIIRVSEEHQSEARRHAAMAVNVFYLKETALDAVRRDHSPALHPASPTVVGLRGQQGRLLTTKPTDA